MMRLLPIINRLVYRALTKVLGFDGMIRFLRLFNKGSGDYTAERHQWLDQMSMDDILADIRKRQENS